MVLEKRLFVGKLTVVVVLLFSSKAFAVQSFLDDWRTQYPDSRSADIRCQLCHAMREGGSPWNAYGRDIRNAFREPVPNTRTIQQAFQAVEMLNSDADGAGINNLAEIMANEQPGWREGRVNLAYNRDDVVINTLFPPVAVDPFIEKLPLVDYPIKLTEAANDFTSPLAGVVAPVPALQSQLFVVDQVGIVWRANLDDGTKSEYLNVQSRLISLGAFQDGGYDQRGLLGFAFHPNFISNGLLYLYLSEAATQPPDFSTLSSSESADHQSVVLELIVSNPLEASDSAIIAGERELLRIDQPQFNHNGGDLQFDSQNLLYIALGDGGGADDQGVGHGEFGNGSDLSNPLGSILRIDPLGSNSGNGKYGIPSDNPFVSQQGRLDEIFAYGFRNPWKLSFDSDGQLYAADVGQNDVEEINRVNSGGHYGWRFKEGEYFFDTNGEFGGLVTRVFPDSLPIEPLLDPLFQYDHDEGISVSGGHVYRGNKIRSLRGKFVFADFQKRLMVGDINTGKVEASTLVPEIFVFSIARDASGELYVMGNATAATSGNTGKLFKLESTIPTQNDELCLPIKSKFGGFSGICL